jgi:hypothetical protein
MKVIQEPPCFSCHAPCCISYVIPLTGFDLWRVVRVLQVPWHEVAEARSDRDAFWDFFALDDTKKRHCFYLRAHPTGACVLLLELPGGHHRCGSHEGRPLACRVYPYKITGSSQLGLEMIHHAMCPPPQRAIFESLAALEAEKPRVTDELYERQLYLEAKLRWNAMAERVPAEQPLAAGDYAEWLIRLYDRMAPLRRGQFADWYPEALELVHGFPLPELDSSAV